MLNQGAAIVHLVQQRVHAVGRMARRLTCLYGFAWCAVVVLLAMLLACLTDYAFRIQEHGIRWILSAAFVGVATWSVLRFLLPALRYRPSNVDVATRIERHDPRFEERLSSAVEFLEQDAADPRAGSLELRRAVISEARNRVDETDLSACIDRRRPRDAALTALAVVSLIACVVAADLVSFWNGPPDFRTTPSSALAVYRLATPWSTADWPRWNALEFKKGPHILARGQDFEAEVADVRGRLPERVELQYWFDGDRSDQIRTTRMKPTAGGTVVHRLENITRPFKYRAVGGDHDNMPWIPLRLVEPPRLASRQLRLYPPAYSGRSPRESGPRIEALVGARVEARGESTKKLKAVRLRVPADPSAANVKVELSEDGMQFSIAADAGWRISESGAYWFELIDEEGLSGGEESAGEIRADQDLPPTVSLEQPESNTYVTAKARPLIRAVAKDDLAVARIELRYLQSGDSEAGEQTVVLREQADAPPRSAGDGGPTQSDKVIVETRWDLSPLGRLAPGDWIDFRVAASDYRPQWGHSNSRRLTVISPDQLEDRLAQRQAAILARLAELLQLQRSARSQTKALEIQLQETGRLEKPDVDQLQSAELNQRQIGRQLADDADGVPAQIRQLLDKLESNRVDNPDLVRRMNELREGIASLARDQMPRIQRNLVNGLKSARDHLRRRTDDADADSTTPAAVKQAGAAQDEAIAALEALLGELTQWDNYRRFARDIHRLQREQEQVRDETDQTRLDTLTKEPRDLTTQERADLKRLAQRQAELARRFDKIQGRMRQMQGPLGQSDPLAAETLGDALDAARRLAISGQMRESSRSIERNRVGQASRQQEQITDSIDELLDVLANRREHELDRLLSQLRRSADDLADMRQRQQTVGQQIKSAAQNGDDANSQQLKDAGAKQGELADAANKLARRLERLQAPQASDATAQAANSQRQSSKSAQQGQGPDAQQKARDAKQKLDAASDALRDRIKQAEQDLFEEQMASLEQAIAGLIGRQQSLLATTTDLYRLQQEQEGPLERGQLATLGDLAGQQRTLATETGIFSEKVARAPVFRLGLEGAVREMARAARGLDRRDPGPLTQQPETAALTRLQQLAEALKQTPAESEPRDQPPGQPPQDSGMSPQDAMRILAELKLVRLMQKEINQRTSELETQHANGDNWSDEQQREVSDLAVEQGQLADLVLELLRQAAEAQPPETKLPEVQLPDARPPEKGNDLDDLDKALDKELLDDL